MSYPAAGAIIFTIIALFSVLSYWGFRSRIPLAALLLQVVMDVSKHHMSVYAVAFSALFIQAALAVYVKFLPLYPLPVLLLSFTVDGSRLQLSQCKHACKSIWFLSKPSSDMPNGLLVILVRSAVTPSLDRCSYPVSQLVPPVDVRQEKSPDLFSTRPSPSSGRHK